MLTQYSNYQDAGPQGAGTSQLQTSHLFDRTELFRFSGLHQPVAFVSSKSVYMHLFAILRDWKIEKIDRSDDRLPVITVQKTDRGYERRSGWLTRPRIFPDPIDAACDFIVDLIHAYLADNGGLLCLHCAAVEFNQGLVVFPNTYRAGKSLLSLKLAANGGRLFTDDVLPITARNNLGLALGILPRLRIPLPELCGQELVYFLEHRKALHNFRYQYVDLAPHEQAEHGTRAPVHAITILQRKADVDPVLMETEKDIVLKDVILRNFARRNPALEIVDRLYAIIEKAECYTLRYSTLDQATELLAEAFGLPPQRGFDHEITEIGKDRCRTVNALLPSQSMHSRTPHR